MTFTEHIQPLLDKRIPAALVAAFLLQTAGALFWAGSAAERITVLERTTADNTITIAKVAVLEEQVAEMKQSLDRIENKLDRAQLRGQRNEVQ
ncbi:MAG TPA: hypothetical protein VHW02_09990 [Rhizomicrobium sp.]|jgi:uncharacterized coiled-coil protein SlyX|nr:hypothetical protein [Rhizomicrobium sp.]